jgi:hypothetical protein
MNAKMIHAAGISMLQKIFIKSINTELYLNLLKTINMKNIELKKFTLGYALTQEQIDYYNEYGFIHFEQFFTGTGELMQSLQISRAGSAG